MERLEQMEKEGKLILKTLMDEGYQAYFVGGYVRDKLLNRPIGDIDIATSARPEEVMRIFKRHVPTGLQHGTVTVLAETFSFEVTTFRRETEYVQFRRPKEVTYVEELTEDLQRRDFTINAMAMDLTGQLLDPFGGWQDLKEGRLRCVGAAADRFQEDALRMMRCIRFAAEYELQIEAQTWEALLEQRDKLVHIAMERIRIELEKMITGSHPAAAVKLLLQSQLLQRLKKNICISQPSLKQLMQNKAIQHLHKVDDANSRWFAFYRMLELPVQACEKSMRQLTFSKAVINSVIALLQFDQKLRQQASEARLNWVESVLQYGEKTARLWLQLDEILQEPKTVYHELGKQWLEQMPVYSIHDLNISGNDLKRLKPKAGPWMGQLLQKILTAAAAGFIPNEYTALLSYAERVMIDEEAEHR